MTTEAPSAQVDIALVVGTIAAAIAAAIVVLLIILAVQQRRSLQLSFSFTVLFYNCSSVFACPQAFRFDHQDVVEYAVG